MIDKQRILDETRGGLDILLDLYPQASKCVEGKAKMFKIRTNERTPSATIKEHKGVWHVCDFGDDQVPRNAIDEWMKVNGYDRSRFGAAVQAIAQEYGIFDVLSKDENFSRVVERAAREDETEGSWQFELRDFTDKELKVLGPGVTAETCRQLNWYACEWIGKVKDRRVKELHSNDSYPIFIRECFVGGGDGGGRGGATTNATDDGANGANGSNGSNKGGRSFFKVYKPMELEKRWRFLYFPEDMKPKRYVNGLHELKREHEYLNRKMRDESVDETGDEGAVPPTKKICDIRKQLLHGVQRYHRVVLCSGERDALCVRARGDFPVWLNSESATLEWDDYMKIIQLAGELTNIPDIDATGIAKGTEKALKFMELQTVWLPESLGDKRDNRGKPCKDFRDWCGHNPSMDDYYELMDTATPAKFWTTRITKDGERKHRIDPTCLHQFLRLNGFFILKDYTAVSNGDPQFIRIKDGVVYKKHPRDIRDFVRLWAAGAKDPDSTMETLRTGMDTRIYMGRDVRNLILTDASFTPAYLSALSTVDPDFTSYTAATQDFVFENFVVHCHADDIDAIRLKDRNRETCVWEDNVIKHRFKKLPPMFAIEEDKSRQWDDGSPRFTIRIDNVDSHYFGFLINSSRLYWRQEIEEPFPNDPGLQEEYLKLHRFDIAGQHLTDEQREDQARCLISKIFTIGYLMHEYKSPSRAWAPYAMDNRIAEGSEANGRSGKSFFFKFLDVMGVERVALSGRNDHLMDNRFIYQNVTRFTRVMEIDDLSQRVPASAFYDNITGDLTVEEKNMKAFILPYEKSPKFAFTTNYVPGDFDPSSDARLLYLTFSDYYHQRTADNPFDYRETRTVRDDFGKDLFGTFYTDDEWNADFNFLLRCEQFYLSLCQRPVKIQPPMGNILQRKLKSDMGETFEDWAMGYFAEDGPNVNRQLVREAVYQDFQKDTHMNAIKMKGFTIRLKAFAEFCPWIHCLNPIEFRNAQGRNIQKTTDPLDGTTRLVEMVHLRTVKEEERIQASYDEIWED